MKIILQLRKMLTIQPEIIEKFKKIITFKEEASHLGRWKLEYCDKKINKKVDLSNEDHCGPCGNYVLNDQSKNMEIHLKDKKVNI